MPLRKLLLLATLVAGLSPHAVAALTAADAAKAAPAFTHSISAEWLNGPPRTLASLHGKVLLIDFWTFACYNCYRSFPWLNTLEQRYASQGLQVIGVHTPEFEHERVHGNIAAKLVEYGLKHPVMIDNDFSYWNAIGNRYWPAFYLVDKQGRVRANYAGETHAGDARAREIEADIRKLLAE
ncbi:MAG TPA: redoxin family protein [Solimonas sp.]|nr:redoxin family protein [Solimonas sp.]